MEDFDGRTAVITGGASGIGLATGHALAKEGMNIVVADIEAKAIDPAVDALSKHGTKVIGVQTDVASREAVNALAQRTFDEMGGCHVLFNNAGVAVFGPIQEMTHEDWEWSIAVNLWGPIYGVEAFVPRMIEQGQGGHVVSTASFAGLVANQGLGVYCVTKYGVVALSECLYRDLRGHGIGVSVLCPMVVETNINQSQRNRQAEFGGPGRQQVDLQEEQQQDLVGGVITADEAAARVVEAIKANRLYIVTHPAAREFVRRRFERIDKSFDVLEKAAE